MITQSEAPAQEVIVVDTLWTNISVDSILTGETISVLTGETKANVTPEKRIPRNKRNIKSLAISPPKKAPITNYYNKTIRPPNISMPSVIRTSTLFSS